MARAHLLPCSRPEVCAAPQIILYSLQKLIKETLLGGKGLRCLVGFPTSISHQREGGREEIISINLCYPILRIFDETPVHHKEKV